jgi:hypothetical protein
MNAWSRLPWGVVGAIGKGEVSVAGAVNRCIVPVSGTDPYAAKGIVEGGRNVWLRSFDKDGEGVEK